MDIPLDGNDLRVVRIPPGTMVDGAVVELAEQPDGTLAAEIRIPGPKKSQEG